LIEAHTDEGIEPRRSLSATRNLETDMPKPRLLLIHSSDRVRRGPKHRQLGRGFRPLVILGGARARSAPAENAWEAALKLVDLGFLACQLNYLSFLQASLTVLEARCRQV
jgi:hypothetical protein